MARPEGLTKQVQNCLDSKLRIGHSKYEDEKLGLTSNYIYSWNTYRSYLKHNCYFVKWAKKEHRCKTLESARPYVNEYLQRQIDRKVSPYTQKLDASAIAKLYGCSTKDFIKTEVRQRKNIVRSRGPKAMDKHFSIANNHVFIDFCRGTGVRRDEIKGLTKEHLTYDEKTDTYYLRIKGKGGLYRNSPVVLQKAVDTILKSGDVIWKTKDIPKEADVHSYRHEYCMEIYSRYARPLDQIPRNEQYRCRGELKGVIYDKRAMKIASVALGHSRISIIAGHYIRT